MLSPLSSVSESPQDPQRVIEAALPKLGREEVPDSTALAAQVMMLRAADRVGVNPMNQAIYRFLNRIGDGYGGYRMPDMERRQYSMGQATSVERLMRKFADEMDSLEVDVVVKYLCELDISRLSKLEIIENFKRQKDEKHTRAEALYAKFINSLAPDVAEKIHAWLLESKEGISVRTESPDELLPFLNKQALIDRQAAICQGQSTSMNK